MPIPPQIIKEASTLIKEHIGEEVEIKTSSPLGGGDINEAFRLETNGGDYFLKYNRADRYPGMFEKEANGLKLLSDAREIRVPRVVGAGIAGNDSFLVLEYIDSTAQGHSFWEDFGTNLARLHKHFGDAFGLDHNNYIGSLQQSNRMHSRWVDFFIEERLEPQLKMARNSGLAGQGLISKMERLYNRLDEIFPVEPPSLIHGDLWSGNYMVDDRGEPCIIDPAVYYGHREMDIGMSKLFGGFSEEFYRAYHAEYPMEKGWQERVDICNLYPLLVHMNLFGMGYVGSVESILRRF